MRRRPGRVAAGAVAAAIVLGSLASAGADEPASCDGARAARLARVLDDEARAASRWRWWWAAGFGAATVGQLGLAAADVFPDDERRDARMATLYLGAGKATIGLGVRLFFPPRVSRPALTGEACADERAARAAIAATARRQRNSMILNVFGGLALNISTSLYVGLAEDSWLDAGISFGLGTVVATASALTQPRRVWRKGGVRADGPLVLEAQLVPWTDGRLHGLGLAGRF